MLLQILSNRSVLQTIIVEKIIIIDNFLYYTTKDKFEQLYELAENLSIEIKEDSDMNLNKNHLGPKDR